MNPRDFSTLEPTATAAVLAAAAHAGTHAILHAPTGRVALHAPGCPLSPAELDARLRQAHPTLAAPAAYWLHDTPPGAADDARWIVIDPQPVPDATEAAVSRLVDTAFAPLCIARDRAFFEAGGHSLGVLELQRLLRRELGVAASYAQLHALATPRLLGAWVRQAPRVAAPASVANDSPSAIHDATPAQAAIYAAARMHASPTVYNVPIAIELNRDIGAARVQGALLALVERHAALRATFAVEGDRLTQRLHARARLPFVLHELAPEALEPAMAAFRQPFDLARGPLLRAALFDTGAARRTLLLDFHHLVVDGVSVQILLRELGVLLDGGALPPPADYAAALAELAQAASSSSHAAAWASHLGDAPLNASRLVHGDGVAATAREPGFARHPLPATLVDAARAQAAAHGASLHGFFLAALNVLLGKWLGEDDVVVGVPCAGRVGGHSLEAVGMYARTLPSRLHVGGERTFDALLQDVAQAHVHRMTHAVGAATWRWAEGAQAGFGVVFASHRFDFVPGRHGRWRPFAYPEAHFDLLVTLVESDAGFALELESAPSLDAALVDDLVGSLLQLASRFAAAATARVRDVGLLDDERALAWRARLNPAMPRAALQGSIVSRWAEVVRLHGHAVALEDAAGVLTYAQADARAQGVAAALIARGVVRGDTVALLSERRADYAVALLGILMAGATYVPLDPGYPPARLAAMAAAAGCRLCIALEGDVPALALPVLPWAELRGTEPVALPDATALDDTAYVMFTSGSTGKPKGVKVTHRNVLRLADDGNAVPVGPRMRVLLTGSTSFDATTYEIWVPLLNGGRVAFVDKQTLLDATSLREAIEQFRPNVMWMTAPLFARHVDAEPSLFAQVEHLIVGGDVVPPAAVAAVQAHTPEVTLVNGYGPTENTTFSTFHVVGHGHTGALPVGRPIARSTAYVLDAGGHLLPPGALGELAVGGEGVAAGYLDAALDADRFVSHRWPDGRIDRLYRTGDLARVERDGSVRLHGRRDAQVKVRGFRVELGEVADALRTFAGVRDAHVVHRRDAGGDALTAYVVMAHGALDEAALLAHLRDTLPAHMVPAFHACVDAIPLNANGKVDASALPATGRPWHDLAADAAAPAPSPLTAGQQVVVDLWRELLRVEHVGLDDDFFRLGGDSLKLVALAARLAPHHGRRPSIPALYRENTPRAQASAFIGASAAAPAPVATTRATPTRLRATDAQSRLVLLDQISGGTAPYLIPILLKLDGDVDARRLDDAWKALGHRHDFLRSRFSADGETAWIDINAHTPPLQHVRVDADAVDAALARRLAEFSLARGDVATAALIETPASAWLAFVFHHAAFDGDAVETLLADFAALHAGRALPAPPPPVAEVWPALTVEADGTATRYWIDRLAGATCEIQLPCDRQRSALAAASGSTWYAAVDTDLDHAIQALAARHGVTPYMVWLAGALVTLGRYARQDYLTIGTVSAGRTSLLSDQVCGMFANTLPLRFALDVGASFESLLAQVRETVLDGLEHQDFSLSDLVAALPARRESWRNPLFNVMFSYVAIDDLAELGQGLQWQRADWHYPSAKFDLTLFVHKGPAHCRVAIEVADGALAQEADVFLRHWLQALRSLTAAPDAPLNASGLVDAAERALVVDAFNDTAAPQRDTLLMHQPFEACVDAAPHACAVIDGDRHVSYAELDAAANRLAHALRAQGCAPGVPVMVMMDRSAEMLVAVLGTLKAGGYYVPVDPSHPALRLAGIAQSLGVRLLVADAASLVQRADLAANITFDCAFLLDTAPATPPDALARRLVDAAQLEALPSSRPHNEARSTDLAYTIFTSGSTGQPKGVAVAHRPAVNLIDWVNERFGVGPNDRLLFVTSLCFDLSVYDVFGTLAAGATVCVAHTEDLRDPSRLAHLLQRHAITFWDSAPAALQQVLQAAAHAGKPISSALRLCFLSGDWVPTTLPGVLQSLFPNVRLVVLGGATEATVWSNFFEVHEDTADWISIPYGRPIRNARYYVLDDCGQPCPVGVPGRLFIAGDCLAEGYANAPALTAERFLADPFVARAEARMYDTGDLARWRADGELVFLGRRDHQVKVRGFRVEIGEVTHALVAHPSVDQVLVLAQRDPAGDMALVAHVVANEVVTAGELSGWLAAQLPSYMIPAWFSFLDALPATINGKFDRERLPGIPELMAQQPIEQATSPAEAEMHAHWSAVLGRDAVPLDLGFHAAGGNSLLLVRLFSRLAQACPGVFTLPDLFAMPTVREQAARLEATRVGLAASLPDSDDTESLERLLERVSRNEIDIEDAMARLPSSL